MPPNSASKLAATSAASSAPAAAPASSSITKRLASVALTDDDDDEASEDADEDLEIDDADAAAADDDDTKVKRVSKFEQLWDEYEAANVRKVKTQLLRRALGGAMTKKGQHKAHWMDLELITYAIETAHNNTKPFSRDYLTQLAVVLAKDNHRNTSAKHNITDDREVVKALKTAVTKETEYHCKPQPLAKLRHQLDWMVANASSIALPIMRRLMQIMSYVVFTRDKKSVNLLDDYFTKQARAKFESLWADADQVKRMEKITERQRNIVLCKRELKAMDERRKVELAALKAEINKRYDGLKLEAIKNIAKFSSEEKMKEWEADHKS